MADASSQRLGRNYVPQKSDWIDDADPFTDFSNRALFCVVRRWTK